MDTCCDVQMAQFLGNANAHAQSTAGRHLHDYMVHACEQQIKNYRTLNEL